MIATPRKPAARAARCWLMKSEPDVYSIDDLQRDGHTPWTGVRNYQARNFMRDDMAVGDHVLFYHSNAEPPGVAGLARVSRAAYPDFTAWDPRSPYYDKKSTPDHPVWMMVEVSFVEKFPRLISLDELRGQPELAAMLVLKRGMRLSVQPVEPQHVKIIRTLAFGSVQK
ncbi:MAG TPA: EVE domain-containing protein [Kiritimatiellia bacterium]|nr:EVE domain-containing protein [Kiritimatiellia bacterium]HMO98764.1 EVE domain-containing protein [Kiritimatiellia bacterium]HMP95940.1 EVE domain-containing protein [Kiritimatiellia bacterium]